MSEIHSSTRKPEDRTIVYHFDIAQHSLPLRQFVDTANATMEILECFNEKLFDGKGEFDLRIAPPESGGLIKSLTVVAIAGSAVWAFLESDMGKAFVEGYTGYKPAHWANQFGQALKEVGSLDFTDDDVSLDISGFLNEVPKDDLVVQSISLEMQAAVLAGVTTAFLEAPADELERIGLTKKKLKKAFSARNDIYQACVNNFEVRGINFSRSSEFRIRRSDFSRFIEDLPDIEEPVPDSPLPWVVEITEIVVNSPNWLRDGRRWQGSTSGFQKITFSIEDKAFWHCVAEKNIRTNIRDRIRVQWVYLGDSLKPSGFRVLRVLSFNGRKLARPLSEFELLQILDTPSIRKPDVRDLFDYADKMENECHNNGG